MSDANLSKLENVAKSLNDVAEIFKESAENVIEGLSRLLGSANKAVTERLGELHSIAECMERASEGNQRAARVMLEASEANSRAASQMAEAAEAMMRAAYRMRD